MTASIDNPIYTVYLVSGKVKYNITDAVLGLSFSDQKKQISKSVQMDLMQAKADNRWLTSLIQVRDRIFIYADDGERNDEVWRGFVWTRSYKSGLDGQNLILKCYDNLIYFQESEESIYFSSGKSTKDIASTLCQKWGVSLEYTYESITHSKLALRGNLSDLFTSDILDVVKDRSGKKYAILSEKDVIKIKTVGTNTEIYSIEAGKNGIYTRSEFTMDGMVTKVVILGKIDKDDRQPIEATVDGKTEQYGTLQKLISRRENTSLADAKKEAQSILKESGSPYKKYEVKAPDIPWIRKGDKVRVNAGDIVNTYLIVVGIDRDISVKEKTMTLSLENI